MVEGGGWREGKDFKEQLVKKLLQFVTHSIHKTQLLIYLDCSNMHSHCGSSMYMYMYITNKAKIHVDA